MTSEKQAFIDKTQARLDRINAEIKRLKAEAEVQSAKSRMESADELAVLESKRDEVMGRLEQLRAKAEDAWRDIAGGFDAAFEDLEASYEAARRRFK
jgi:predicted  nucleic acid-binding Zn-ribbon protein